MQVVVSILEGELFSYKFWRVVVLGYNKYNQGESKFFDMH